MQSMFLSSSSRRYSRVVGRFGPTISLASVCRPSYRSAAPDGVAGSQRTKREGAGGKRDTGGSPKFEEFAASPRSFVHEQILSRISGVGNQQLSCCSAVTCESM